MITTQDFIDIMKKIEIKADLDHLDPDSPLSDQGIDSLDMISILFALEERYGVKIPEEEISEGRLSTMKTIIEYLNRASS